MASSISSVAAAAGLMTSLTLTLQSSEYRCKSTAYDAFVVFMSLGSFAAVNLVSIPALYDHINILNQIVVVMPPVLNTMNTYFLCQEAAPAGTNPGIDSAVLFMNIALPLAIYQIVSNKALRDRPWYHQNVASLAAKVLPSSVAQFIPQGNAAPYDMEVQQAKDRALDALHRAMRNSK